MVWRVSEPTNEGHNLTSDSCGDPQDDGRQRKAASPFHLSEITVRPSFQVTKSVEERSLCQEESVLYRALLLCRR